MDEPRFPWQIPYLAAIIELDPLRLPAKIGEAEIAIAARLAHHPKGEELEALTDALQNLRFLLNQKNRENKTDVA
jgi:hypothetical protein